MSEAIAFFCGFVTMGIVWFVNDTKNNPYMRGYAEGLRVGIDKTLKEVDKMMSDITKRLDKIMSDMRDESE